MKYMKYMKSVVTVYEKCYEQKCLPVLTIKYENIYRN